MLDSEDVNYLYELEELYDMEENKNYTTLRIFPRVTNKTYLYFKGLNRCLSEPKTYITYWLECTSSKHVRIDIMRMAIKCNIYINCNYYTTVYNCDNFITETLDLASKNNYAVIVDNYGEYKSIIKDLFGHPLSEKDAWLKYAIRN